MVLTTSLVDGKNGAHCMEMKLQFECRPFGLLETTSEVVRPTGVADPPYDRFAQAVLECCQWLQGSSGPLPYRRRGGRHRPRTGASSEPDSPIAFSTPLDFFLPSFWFAMPGPGRQPACRTLRAPNGWWLAMLKRAARRSMNLLSSLQIGFQSCSHVPEQDWYSHWIPRLELGM